MTNTPFFSVVVPAFNAASRLPYTLASVLSQSEADFEVIVVDDCSGDVAEVEALIARLDDSRIRLIKHAENKNGAAARNTGIHHATGRYIAFLDADDFWPPERLAIVRAEIEGSDRASTAVFYGQVAIKYPEQAGGIIKPVEGVNGRPVSDYLFLQDGLIQTSTIVCDRNVAHAIEFDERFVRHQDYDFCLRAGAGGFEFRFIPQILSHWHLYKGRTTLKKGASFTFCRFWMDEMASYFTPDALKAYQVKVLAPVAAESGHFPSAAKILMTQARGLPVRVVAAGIWKTAKSLVRRFIYRLR